MAVLTGPSGQPIISALPRETKLTWLSWQGVVNKTWWRFGSLNLVMLGQPGMGVLGAVGQHWIILCVWEQDSVCSEPLPPFSNDRLGNGKLGCLAFCPVLSLSVSDRKSPVQWNLVSHFHQKSLSRTEGKHNGNQSPWCGPPPRARQGGI